MAEPYFTAETHRQIKIYLECEDVVEKHRIFCVGIKPALEKLIENQIYVYGFYTIDNVDTLKMEALTNLYEMLPKFDPDRGTKAFSYFNVVCKNWFIQKIREKDKNMKGTVSTDTIYDLDSEIAKGGMTYSMNPHEDDIIEREFWKVLFENMDFWRKKLTKKPEKQVLEAVIFMLQNPNLVPIYNKKAVYLYLRELTGLNTKQVVINLKKIKDLYVRFKDQFDTSGEGEQHGTDCA